MKRYLDDNIFEMGKEGGRMRKEDDRVRKRPNEA